MLEVVNVLVSDLKPYIKNARSHPPGQVRQIVASIREFGFTNPILIDADNDVIAGHGRLLAARMLELAEVPAIRLESLSKEQVRALRVADNKIALNSAWDEDLLRIELGELKGMDITFALEVTGFSGGEIDLLLTEKPDPGDDEIPPVPNVPRTQFGDVWQLGEHRIGCGDGRDTAFLHQVIGDGASVDCAFLDPPYNVKINGHANVRSKHREFAMASGEMSEDQFRAFLADTLGACITASRDGAVHFVCMDWRHYGEVVAAADVLYGEQINLCVWNKSNAGMGNLYRSKHELVLVYRVGSARHHNAVELGRHGRNRTNVWDYASVNTFRKSRKADLDLHPTVKPTAMVADAIQDVTRRGDLVLDIFLGSGTTLIACERTGRRFRGLDIAPEYVDVAVDRWVAMTGGVPVLERSAPHAQA